MNFQCTSAVPPVVKNMLMRKVSTTMKKIGFSPRSTNFMPTPEMRIAANANANSIT